MPQLERSASISQTSTNAKYQSFGYYNPGADIAQPPPSYYSNDTSSTKSLSTGTHQHSSYYLYGSDYFTYRKDKYDNVSHRNSM